MLLVRKMNDEQTPSENQDQETVRTGISLPKMLLKQFDTIVQETSYVTRSEAIRDAMKRFISKYEQLHEGEGTKVGALMVLYNHEREGIDDALTEIQHHHLDTILNTIHIHLSTNRCLEIIVVEGEANKIKNLSEHIIGGKGIEEVKSVLINQS